MKLPFKRIVYVKEDLHPIVKILGIAATLAALASCAVVILEVLR